MSYSFAIIGGGLTATSMLCQLVEKLGDLGSDGKQFSERLNIVVFEKKAVFGPGLPHNEEYVLPFHITNMCAKDMSVFHGRPADFQEWVEKNLDILKKEQPDLFPAEDEKDYARGPCQHYPRALMGEYLKSRFTEAVDSARLLGISVQLFSEGEITDISHESGRFLLKISSPKNGQPDYFNADGVLLATGHWSKPSPTKNYLASPWPATELLTGIPAGEKVGVIGSSLSAIEVALTLTSDGRFVRGSSGKLKFIPADATRTLTLYSRNGFLPRVRGRIGERSNHYFNCETILELTRENPARLKLSTIFDLLSQELSMAYGFEIDWQQIACPTTSAAERLVEDIELAKSGDGDDGEIIWQTVLVQIFPVVRELYLNLSLAERKHFDREFSTLFFMHAATQPIINGEKLLALIEAGTVSVVSLGNSYHFEHDEEKELFTFTYKGSEGASLCDSFRYVVNATGQLRAITSDNSLLPQNLLQRHLVSTEEVEMDSAGQKVFYASGSILVDSATHQVIQPGEDNHPQNRPQLFAVGAMTRGQMIDTSMAYGLARSTKTIADNLIAQLLGNNEPEA